MKRFLSCLALFTLSQLHAAEPAIVPPTTGPRLAVVISIDQCRADYLQRFRPYFVEGGFRRLLEQGDVYADAHHRHALTATAPGHATLLTGVSANLHGIIANDWFDVAAGRKMNGVEDAEAPLVGSVPQTVAMPGGGADAEFSGSPRRLLAATVGDQIKLRFGASSRVISVANKDRAAIFMGGRLGDAAYWIVDGRAVTSRYYREALPDWVVAFNNENLVNAAFGHTWDRLLDISIYNAIQGPDDAPGEEGRLGLGRTFPRRVDGGSAQIGPAFYNAYRLDPHGSGVLGQLVQRAVVNEKLGHHDTPDLLCVGFSQIDYAGHSYGPDSHEVMDSFLRLDRVIAELLTFLDREVGEKKYVLVLSADHGAAPLPERTQAFARGVVAGRLDGPGLDRQVEAALTTAFGAPANGAAWALRDGYGYRLIASSLANRSIDGSAAQLVVKATLLKSSQIGVAYTRDELTGRVPATGPFLEDWRLSFNAERSPDVMFSPSPYVVDRTPAGTNHGTPYDYDKHVPLIWFGAGINAAVHTQRIGTDSIAPTLSALLGVPAPPLARGARLF
ncbi:MAG: alkaline phosphatase family protein [Opitutus sp.]